MTPEQKAHKLTDDNITALEHRISAVYKQANEDVTAKLNAYMEQFKRLDEQKLKQVADGVLSQADYKQWRVGKIAIGENWKAIQNNLAQDYVNADKIAASIINGDMANVYALNHNYAAYALESGTNMNLQFTLYDKSTVEGLLKENKNLLPQRKIDVPKDLRWNKQKIQSAVTQGILQGEPIDKIANRLQQVTDMNRNAAVRNARTAATGAENAGRQDTYNEAVSKGIKLKKEWLATLDSRTRDAHQQLDGQRVEEDKPFKSEFGDIMYPGDPSADPANVYNCRCTMIAVVDGVDDIAKSVGEYQPRMTYSEWKNEHIGTQSTGIESLRQVAEQSTDKYDFWTNLDENQQAIFKASGMKIDDVFNQLHSGASLSEWKAPAPGGPESFAIQVDASTSLLKFNPVPARSEGWMADATGLGVINVRNDGLGDTWDFIIAHEAGHQISNMSSELQQMIITNPGNILGKYNTRLMLFDGIYGEYNPEEAFATGVSNYIRYPESMEQKYPEAYKAIDTLFTTSPSALEYIKQAMRTYKKEFMQ